MYARQSALAVALLLAITARVHASDTTFVKRGSWVRLEAPGFSALRLVGRVSDLDQDTLVLRLAGSRSALSIPLSDIENVKVRTGQRSNWLLGGAVGFVFFGALGAAIGAAEADRLPSFGEPSRSEAAAAGAIIGAVAGFGIGAVIGSRFKSDRWVRAQLPAHPPLALSFGKDGSVGLAISLRL